MKAETTNSKFVDPTKLIVFSLTKTRFPRKIKNIVKERLRNKHAQVNVIRVGLEIEVVIKQIAEHRRKLKMNPMRLLSRNLHLGLIFTS